MKMPAPNLLIANPELILTAKMAKGWMEDRFYQTYNLPINIYKRLNTCVCKQVLSEYKRLKSDIEYDYQMVETNIGIAPIGGLRL
ncbi:MAG: hypothetical protein IPJ54_16820 [Saprospiraceae bacterium]|nr:hypothetical protein [Saprospiraceae bacterium]